MRNRITPHRALFLTVVVIAVAGPLSVTQSVAAATDAWVYQSTWIFPDGVNGTSGIDHPKPALGDLDGDGKLDLIIGTRTSWLYAYKNTGTASAPDWTATVDTPSWVPVASTCGGATGEYSPALVDLDGDGDLDLVLGTNAKICIYQNTGTPTVPSWVRADGTSGNPNWETGLPAFNDAVPALADLNNDGRLDLMVSQFNKGPMAYENTGTGIAPNIVPSWTANPAWDGLDTGGGSNPMALADMDGDGKNDMAIVNTTNSAPSAAWFFKNTGSLDAPQWTFVGNWRLPLPLSSTFLSFVGVTLGDLDGDGKPELLYSHGSTGDVIDIYKESPAGLPPPDYASGAPAPSGATVVDTFDGFACAGTWLPAAGGPNSSYIRDCGNGWIAYAEDVTNKILASPTSGPVGDQSVVTLDNGVNGPSAATATPLGAAQLHTAPDDTPRGALWLLKTFPVVPGQVIRTLADFRIKVSGGSRERVGVVVFDGTVTNPSGQTDTFGMPLRPDVLTSDIQSLGLECAANTWCPWNTVDLTNIVPYSATVTVALIVNDTRNSQTSYAEFDNLTVSGVQNAPAASLPVGDMAQLWKQDYQAGGTNSGGQSSNSAEAVAVKVDAAGNIYVAGHEDNGANHDIVTFKYDTAGNQLWKQTYDGGDTDKAVALTLDASGNVYVTGRSFNSATGSNDYAAIKYDANGNLLWSSTYDNGGTGRDDEPAAAAVDGTGHLYVTGASCSGLACDYATVMFDTTGASGTAPVWSAIYDGGGSDSAVGIGLDSADNVYVTGTSSGIGDDIVTLKYDSAGNQLRLNRYDSGTEDRASVMATDSAGDVYIAGVNYKTSNAAMVVLKYASAAVSGDAPLWVKTTDVNYQTLPTAMTMDASGSVYVTGYTGDPGNTDFITVKYLSNGDIAWAQTFGNAGLDDRATGVALDSLNNVYVVGALSRSAGNADYVLVKYDSSGVARNAISYDGYNLSDAPVGIALSVDAQGDVVPVVAGTSADTTGLDHIATVRYERAQPDLTMTEVSGPASGVPNGTIDVDNVVQSVSDLANKIGADAGPFQVSLYLAPDVGGAPDLGNLILLGSRSVAGLAGGQANGETTTVIIPSVTAPGNYYLVALADSSGAVLEANESNNQVVSAATLAIAQSDLVVNSISAPTSVSRDVPFDVTTTVANLVSSPTPTATPFRVGIYLSTDSTITTGDIFIGSRTIANLAGFASDTATTSVTVPSATVAAGNYYIGAIVDDQDVVVESNENNNSAVQQAPAGNSALLTTDVDFTPGLSVSGTTDVVVVGTGTAASVSLAIDNSPSSLAWQAPSPGWGAPTPPVAASLGAYALGNLDGDASGTLDMIAGDATFSKLYGYSNSSITKPVWTRQATWDIASPCGAGFSAFPTLADLNGDGLLDLVIGTSTHVCIYKNTGTGLPGDAPVWTRADGTGAAGHTAVGENWESGLPASGTNLYPAVADLDGDGIVDLMLGQDGGQVNGYKFAGINSGTGACNSSPCWIAQAGWDLVVGSYNTAPTLADLDGDGKIDMLVGTRFSVAPYRNTCTTCSNGPSWSAGPQSWAVSGLGNGYVYPVLQDLSGDGRIDLLMGMSLGNKYYPRVNIPPYFASGTYISPVIDAGIHGGYTTLSYSKTEPGDSALRVDIRAGDVADTSDSSWTTWVTDIAPGGDISTLLTHRYVQYRAVFTPSTTQTQSPTLDDIEANKLPPGPQYATVSVSAGGGSGGGALGWLEVMILMFLIMLTRGHKRPDGCPATRRKKPGHRSLDAC